MPDYDKMIEVKKKELARVEAQIKTVSADRDKIISDGNKIIYANKKEAEKIISDAKIEVEKIIAAANEVKDKNEAEEKRLLKESSDLKDKQSDFDKEQNNLAKGVDNLEKDKADFAKDKKEKMAEINKAIKKAGEVIDYLQSIGKVISDKVSDITKE